MVQTVPTMASFSSRKGNSASNKPNLTICPPGIDALTSFAPTIPEEIKASIPLFHNLSGPAVQQAIDHVLRYLIDHNTACGSYHKVGSIAPSGISEAQFLSFQNELRQQLGNGNAPASSSSSSVVAVVDPDVDTALLFSALYSLLLHVIINRVKLSTLTQGNDQRLSPHSLTLHQLL